MKKIMMFVLLLAANFAWAASVTVDMYPTDPDKYNKKIGTIQFDDTKQGLLMKPNLHDLSPGKHGIHVHAINSCGKMGMAAGGHYDPENMQKHLGPNNPTGHKGDLPVLTVNKDGKATMAMLAPRLSVADLKGRTIIIHAGGDNYSDEPQPLGGGGARIACGVVQ